MKKIAIIIGDVTKTGGSERATVNLANILISLHNNVTIISISGNEFDNSYYQTDANIRILFLKLSMIKTGLRNRFLWYNLFIKRLKDNIKGNSYDTIIGTGHAINSLLPIIVKNKKIKIIACEHIVYDSLPFTSKIIRRIMYHYVDAVVVLNKIAEKKFSYLNHVVVIPNSLSFSTKKVNNNNSKQIISVGRLSKEKGFDRLLKIVVLLKENNSDWKIRIVGDGELKENLKESCKLLNLDSYINFSPFTKDILEEYLKSSIYVLTSYSEAFPMVLLEAKACGLPIVSFDCPEGPRSIINDGIDGFLINDGDIASFYSKLSLLMEDDKLRELMSKNSKKDSLNYLPDKIGLLWKSLIDEIG